jgi:hypothetical protein
LTVSSLGCLPPACWPPGSPGTLAQLRHRCTRVKRDGTAGLGGCWVRRPPKAATPSRRVRPPASIALDRDHGQPPTAGHGRWRGEDAPSARAASLASSAALPAHRAAGLTRPGLGAAAPTATPTSIPTAFPAPPMAYPTGSRERSSVQVSSPSGEVERALGKVRFARLIHSGARVLGGPLVRAAFGGNLNPAWLLHSVVLGDSAPKQMLVCPAMGGAQRGLITSSDRRREVGCRRMLNGSGGTWPKGWPGPVPSVAHRHAQEDFVLNPAVGAL